MACGCHSKVEEINYTTGVVINVEKNPFRGIIISIKDESGRIFFGEEKYFQLA